MKQIGRFQFEFFSDWWPGLPGRRTVPLQYGLHVIHLHIMQVYRGTPQSYIHFDVALLGLRLITNVYVAFDLGPHKDGTP